jgi:septum formation protein
MKTLVLASASPRRKFLLQEAGISFVLFPVKVSETLRKNLSIDEQIISIAEEKALAALDLYKPADSKGFLILSADTEVILDGQALGKPLDQGHACQILERLSGRSHEVKTAIVLLEGIVENFGGALGKDSDPSTTEQKSNTTTADSPTLKITNVKIGKVLKQVETTKISFKKLSSEQITNYVASGEAMDKAGAYGIQGLAKDFVASIEGPFDNVVGLPMDLLKKMLAKF